MELEAKKIKKIKIEEISKEHFGDRVCLDFNSLLGENEGLLVGNYSRGLFLINNEKAPEAQKYEIEERPFRVNAGVVSAYVYMPNGKTKYLSELRTGDKVLIINPKGHAREVEITRLKIETRPMTLIRGTSIYDKEIPLETERDLTYFKTYREIFKWYDPHTMDPILKVQDVESYIGKKLHVKMDISTYVQTAETVRLVKAPEEKPISITDLELGMEVYAYIINPTLRGRHFGTEYEGFCLEV